MHKNRTLSIVAIIIVVALVAGIGYFYSSKDGWKLFSGQQVSTDNPVDIVFDFYSPWLEAAQSTSTDPYQQQLATTFPYLSESLRNRLTTKSEGVDPVLCQTVIPARISSRKVYEGADMAQILVTARRPATSTEQALITLLPSNGGWYINDIKCSAGEIPPEREFSFDREGELTKNVSEPLSNQNWHLVFEEDGEAGHIAPLFFATDSVCVDANGTSGACNPESFTESGKAHVQGQMTERGVEVKKVELRK